MAVTNTVLVRSTTGRQRRRLVEVTFDSSYPTGGEAIAASDVELARIDHVNFSHLTVSGAHSNDQARWDAVNNKLLLGTWPGVQVADTTDRSATKAYIEFVGV